MKNIIDLEQHPRQLRKNFLELLGAAHKAYSEGNTHEAIRRYEQAKEVAQEYPHPERLATPILYLKLSDSYAAESKSFFAVHTLEEGLKKFPNNLDILSELGLFYLKETKVRNPFKALSYFQRIKTLCPQFQEGNMSIDEMIIAVKTEVEK